MCGNRLNAWKTIPIRRRIRSTSTPRRGDLVAVEHDPTGVDRLEQVDAAEQGRLARARGADEADDLVLGDRQVDPAQDLDAAERLVEALDPDRGGRVPAVAGARSASPGARGAAPPVARDEHVGQPGQRDRDDQEEHDAVTMYGVKLNEPACRIWDWRKISTTPMNDTSTVSFWRPMKSFSSGGMTRRTACGRTTWRSAWNRVSPSDRAAASWLGWTESMPAR